MPISKHPVIENARISWAAILFGLAWVMSATTHAVQLKIATDAPDGSLWMSSLRTAAAEISEKTENRVTFKFYPGGVMGNDMAVMRKIRSGQLSGAVMTVGGLTRTYPDIELYGLPLLFRSLDEVDYVRSRMDQTLLRGLEERGFVAFGIAEIGFAYAMSQAVVRNLDEVRAQKVWVPAGDQGAARTLAAFDISPIPLSVADVLGGLQTGLINGVAVPPVAAIVLQWHTQLHHALDLPLMYVYGTLAVSDRQFSKLSDSDQLLVRERMKRLVEYVNGRNRRDHERAVEVLKSQGVSWNMPTAQAASEWQHQADRVSLQLVDAGVVSAPMFQQLMQYLSDCRKTQ